MRAPPRGASLDVSGWATSAAAAAASGREPGTPVTPSTPHMPIGDMSYARGSSISNGAAPPRKGSIPSSPLPIGHMPSMHMARGSSCIQPPDLPERHHTPGKLSEGGKKFKWARSAFKMKNGVVNGGSMGGGGSSSMGSGSGFSMNSVDNTDSLSIRCGYLK